MPQTPTDKLLELQKEYQLPANKNELIFRNDILPRYANLGQQTEEFPRAVILGGQPGAGKSTLMFFTKNEHNFSGDKMGIAADDYRHFHPRYNFLLDNYSQLAPLIVTHDANKWAEKMLDKCVVKKVNVVVEGSMGKVDWAAEKEKMLKQNRYSVKYRIMAMLFCP